MSAIPILASFDGKVLVPKVPLDAAPGTSFEVRPSSKLGTQMSREEWLAFIDRTAGSWVGAEMEDPEDPSIEAEEQAF